MLKFEEVSTSLPAAVQQFLVPPSASHRGSSRPCIETCILNVSTSPSSSHLQSRCEGNKISSKMRALCLRMNKTQIAQRLQACARRASTPPLELDVIKCGPPARVCTCTSHQLHGRKMIRLSVGSYLSFLVDPSH